jgi:uncharacterized membrane protein
MSQAPKPRPLPRKGRVLATMQALVRTRLTTGLLVILPIYVTYWLIRFVFELMRDSSKWIVEHFLRSQYGRPFLERWKVPPPEEIERHLGHVPSSAEIVAYLPDSVQWGVAITSVLLTLFLLYMIGLFAANIVGRRVLELFEYALDRVPIVKTIYRACKQIFATFSGDRTSTFQRAAIVPFMTPQVKTLGFITNTFTDPASGTELCTVFVPTTPNPTSGFVLILRRSEIRELDWSAEESVQALISAGILFPSSFTAAAIDLERQIPSSQRSASSSPPSANA